VFKVESVGVGGAPPVAVLRSRYDVAFVFVVKQSQLAKFKLDSLLPRIVGFVPFKVVPVHGETLGSLQTLQLARSHIDATAPLLLCTCSNVTQWLPGTSVDDMIDTPAAAAVETVQSNDSNNLYVKTTSHQDASIVTEIHKKLPISNQACTGLYFWRSAADFFKAAEATLSPNKNSHQPSYTIPMAYNDGDILMVRAGLVAGPATKKGRKMAMLLRQPVAGTATIKTTA